VFTVLEQWALIVCEPCQHVVWPRHVAGHCRYKHGADHVQAAAIAAGYENAEDLKYGPKELELSPYVEAPIPFLPNHRGLACQVDPDTCRHVSLTARSMRSHIKLKVAHGQGQQSTTATRLRQRQQAIGADTRQWRDTFCQRFFTSGARFSYFEVRHVRRGTTGRPPTPEPTIPDRESQDRRRPRPFWEANGPRCCGV
ncbi:Protein of unknown function (DUF3505) domain containing protein, partial [Elaphomyces granulatus]